MSQSILQFQKMRFHFSFFSIKKTLSLHFSLITEMKFDQNVLSFKIYPNPKSGNSNFIEQMILTYTLTYVCISIYVYICEYRYQNFLSWLALKLQII